MGRNPRVILRSAVDLQGRFYSIGRNRLLCQYDLVSESGQACATLCTLFGIAGRRDFENRPREIQCVDPRDLDANGRMNDLVQGITS